MVALPTGDFFIHIFQNKLITVLEIRVLTDINALYSILN